MFLSLQLSNVVFNFVYKCTVYQIHCPSRFGSIYLNLSLTSDPDLSEHHQKDSANKNVT